MQFLIAWLAEWQTVPVVRLKPKLVERLEQLRVAPPEAVQTYGILRALGDPQESRAAIIEIKN